MLVMKFGGTSVGTPEAIRRTADIIKSARKHQPVVAVVSALSGVTDKLIALGTAAKTRTSDPASALQGLYEHHRNCCVALELDPTDLLAPLEPLGEVVRGVYLLRELTARSADFIVGHGELLSSRIVAAYLSSIGVSARAVAGWDAGIITDANHGSANLLPATYDEVPRKLTGIEETIPIVTGFVGRSSCGERTTLGRGGSDYSAAIIGKALGAQEIQIWTDVSGIYTTDPRVVVNATSIPEVSFQEAAELAYFGAKVIHPKTIEPAVGSGIPVRVKSTFNPEHEGTRIVGNRQTLERDVVALAVKRRNTILTLESTRMLDAEGYLANVFNVLKAHKISVDAISTSEVSVCMTVEHKYQEALKAAVPALEAVAKVDLRQGRTIVCVVGEGMREQPGTAAKIFEAVRKSGANIEMISMGSSRINVTFVVRDDDADTTLRLLHEKLIEQAS
jgi:aspartate kinase